MRLASGLRVHETGTMAWLQDGRPCRGPASEPSSACTLSSTTGRTRRSRAVASDGECTRCVWHQISGMFK
eukprot:12429891-Heterocapsa_arctica.AAC.1